MYVYQFFNSGRVCGVPICDDESIPEAESLCTVMKATAHGVNKALAELLTNQEEVFEKSAILSGETELFEKERVYGSLTLHPMLLCLKDLVKTSHEGINPAKLANMLMSIMSASPMIDYDTTYGSRAYITKKKAYYLWINDFTLQTLIDDSVSYVEVSNNLAKVSDSARWADITDEQCQAEEKETSCGDKLKYGCKEWKGRCIARCPNCHKWTFSEANFGVCKGCEISQLQREITMNTYDYGDPVKARQEYVDIKWSTMHLSAIFAKPFDRKCKVDWLSEDAPEKETFEPGSVDRLVQKVNDRSACERVGPQKLLQCHEFKTGAASKGGCDPFGCGVTDEAMKFKPPLMSNTFALPEVAGMDYASPECSTFNARSIEENLPTHLEVLYKVAQDKGPKNYHVHSGEGFPIYDKNWYFTNYPIGKTAHYTTKFAKKQYIHKNKYDMKIGEYQNLCKVIKRSYNEQLKTRLKQVYCGNYALTGDMKPCHVVNGRNNILQVTTGIANFRKTKGIKEFDSLITTRLGHATQGDYNLGVRMAEANVKADINLSSNLATAAYSWPVDKDGNDLPRPSGIFGRDPTGQSIARHDIKLIMKKGKQQAKLIRGFANHGFLPLFMAGVEISFGSDGVGIEHSEQPVDYKIGAILLKHMQDKHEKAPPEQGGKGWTPKTPEVVGNCWEHKLLLAHKRNKSKKKLEPADWTLKTLLNYGAAHQKKMVKSEKPVPEMSAPKKRRPTRRAG